MSSAAVSTHSGAGPLSLMSCVRESSPLQDFDSDTEKNVGTKKKFWNRIKWFKRKNKVIEDSVLPVSDYIPATDSLRSRSTSELSIEEPPRKRNGSSMYPGLSVSHDSVFHSPHSGSETDLDVAHSSSSLCIPNQQQADLQTELSERLRLRRSGVGRGDTSEDDEGLPHSPCNSPTTTDSLDKTALKDLPNKSHSTCSDGSLLSVGSSDIEEDSLISHIKHSSKSSLSENRHDFDLNASSIPLNHSAAHHRLAVRPKKTHGVPKRKKVQQLPTTIEVNEDSSIRSSSPDVNLKASALELYNTSRNHASLSESQLKSSSLPLGLAAPETDNNLTKNRSNVGSKSQDGLEEKEEKSDRSFFERFFPRRSAKKKKSKQHDDKKEEKKIKLEEHYIRHEDKKKNEEYRSTERYNFRDETISMYYKQQTESSYRRYETKPIPAVRSGAAYRQRILPNDIPDSPEPPRKEEEHAKTQLPDVVSTSPLQMELENKLKQRLTRSSPSQSFELLAEQKDEPKPRYFEPKIAGLSALQQKVMSLHEDETDYLPFKSLTEFPSSQKISLLTKSHSFKTTKSSNTPNRSLFVEPKESPMSKSSSLDSVKVFETNEKVGIFTQHVEHQREVKQETVEIKCDITIREDDNLDEQIARCMMETKNICEGFPDKNNVTISGPSHTAVVNIKNTEFYNVEETQTKVEIVEKNPLISITKINVQPEIEEVPKSPLIIETKPLIVAKSPKKPEQTRFNFDVEKPFPRKFSKDDVEIIEKDDNDDVKTSPIFMITSITPTVPLFKKNEKFVQKKSSIISITPESPTRDNSMKSSSLDSLISDHMDSTDKSSQDSLDNVTEKSVKSEAVILRKKSSVKERREEEPELMKVFARRSLKLRDCENESLSQQLSVMMSENCDKTRDSDKENQTDSPVKERRKSMFKVDEPRKKSISDDENQESDNKKINAEIENKEKEPLIESNVVHSKPIPIKNNSRTESEITDVTLRKTSLEQNYQRAISLTNSKTVDNSQKILRQQFNSRRRTDNWITNIKNEECEETKDEDTKEVSDLIIEPKNFNQRKAEWEKRAQEAQKKSTP